MRWKKKKTKNTKQPLETPAGPTRGMFVHTLYVHDYVWCLSRCLHCCFRRIESNRIESLCQGHVTPVCRAAIAIASSNFYYYHYYYDYYYRSLLIINNYRHSQGEKERKRERERERMCVSERKIYIYIYIQRERERERRVKK